MSNTLNEIPVTPVAALLEQAVTRFAGSPAMYFAGRSWNYRELGEWVNRVARGFYNVGARKGTRIGLCLPNSPYSVVCYYAALKIGAVVVNFSPLYVARELAELVEDSGTTIMVTLDLHDLCPKIVGLLDGGGLERVIVCPMAAIAPDDDAPASAELRRSGGAVLPDDHRVTPLGRLLGSKSAPPVVEIDAYADTAVLQYTGGTTGVPKAASLTHANLTANVEQVRQWIDVLDLEGGRVLCVLPLFHVFAMTVAMNLGIRLGAELILMPRFDIGELMRLISHKRPSLFPAVPTIYTAVNAAAKAGSCDLSSIKLCISGGAPLPLEVRREFESLSGCRLVEGYGLSEASPVLTIGPVDEEAVDGSAGRAIPGTVIEIRATDDPATVLPVGEKGEVCVRGPQVMAGYWRRPGDTADVMVDGALRTGDVGYLDGDGNLFLVDRIKDLIICGGYNVYPRVIEEALHRHPAVAEVIVIGVPDSYRGQSPKAFIRLHDGASATEEEMKAFLTDYLSPVEMPRSVEFRQALPKTLVGKLSKKALAAEEEAASAG